MDSSQDKNLPATARKLQKARSDGQTARSRDLSHLAILGVGITGGIQIGYASLVDLQTGQVIWFNQLARGTGDLREADSARETVDALFTGFPAVR